MEFNPNDFLLSPHWDTLRFFLTWTLAPRKSLLCKWNIFLLRALPGVAEGRGWKARGDREHCSRSFPALTGFLAGCLGTALRATSGLPCHHHCRGQWQPRESFLLPFGSDSAYRSLSQEPEKAGGDQEALLDLCLCWTVPAGWHPRDKRVLQKPSGDMTWLRLLKCLFVESSRTTYERKHFLCTGDSTSEWYTHLE